MKKFIFLFVSIFIVWKFNIIDIALNKYYEWKSHQNKTIDIKIKYTCDGRTWCSQMTSCEEATFFSHNCSDTMDGDGDGVPCESQWCGH